MPVSGATSSAAPASRCHSCARSSVPANERMARVGIARGARAPPRRGRRDHTARCRAPRARRRARASASRQPLLERRARADVQHRVAARRARERRGTAAPASRRARYGAGGGAVDERRGHVAPRGRRARIAAQRVDRPVLASPAGRPRTRRSSARPSPRRASVAVVAGHEREVERRPRSNSVAARGIARVPRQRAHAVRPRRVQRRDGARHESSRCRPRDGARAASPGAASASACRRAAGGARPGCARGSTGGARRTWRCAIARATTLARPAKRLRARVATAQPASCRPAALGERAAEHRLPCGRASSQAEARQHEGARPLGERRAPRDGIEQQPVEAGARAPARSRVATTSAVSPSRAISAMRAGVGRHGRHAGEHRLQQRLRHAFVRVGRQREHVERGSHGATSSCLPAKMHARARCRARRLRLERRALRAVADDHERARRRGGAAAAPRAGSDGPSSCAASRRCRRAARSRGRPSARRAAPRSRGMEARRVDAGRHRVDARRSRCRCRASSCARSVSPVVTMRAVARGRASASRGCAAPATEMWRVRTSTARGRSRTRSQRHASAASHVSVELWRVDDVDRGARGTRRAARARPRGCFSPIGSASAGTPKRGASARMRAPGAA